MFPGDKNGVCWHLGTSYGSQPWVNPMLAGRVHVRASSPACRNTDPRAIVGHTYLHNNFAGPRLENGQLSRCAQPGRRERALRARSRLCARRASEPVFHDAPYS